MDNNSFFMKTRRYLAWGLAGVAAITLSFLAIFGALTGQMELVNLGAGALIAALSGVIGYYLGKKTSQ